jgi:hypothetical protein
VSGEANRLVLIADSLLVIPKSLDVELAKHAKSILSKSHTDLQEAVLVSDEYPKAVIDHFSALGTVKNRKEFAKGIMLTIYLINFYK